jgi:hypothetical protein
VPISGTGSGILPELPFTEVDADNLPSARLHFIANSNRYGATNDEKELT